ncbi:MAG: class I SAM-dependent methyltransferase [Actinomycetota bacterium]|nr:class I SAM-dependent methyltransferase [Actinomycetota bacterium]
MSDRIDYDRMAVSYDRGRALSPEAADGWRRALSDYLSLSDGPVLDLGSGTGVWSVLLADWFDTDVVAIEPSEGMRRQAADNRLHPRVLYAGGEAERIPIKDRSCSYAWLSTVIYHVSDLTRCARELRRVLEPGGLVFIRNAFAGRTGDIKWTRFFPSAHRLADTTLPTVKATVKAFSVAGYVKENLVSVAEVSAPNLCAYFEKVRMRADSFLTQISDEEFDRGLAALATAAYEEQPAPVLSRLDLLVLRERAGLRES